MKRSMIRLMLGCVFLALVLAACSRESNTPPPAPETSAIEWAALSQLDELAHDAKEALVENEVDVLVTLIEPLRAQSLAVAAEPVPLDLLDAPTAAVLQEDLKAAVEKLPEPFDSAQSIAELETLLEIIEKLVEAAGLPHRHGDAHEGHHHHDH